MNVDLNMILDMDLGYGLGHGFRHVLRLVLGYRFRFGLGCGLGYGLGCGLACGFVHGLGYRSACGYGWNGIWIRIWIAHTLWVWPGNPGVEAADTVSECRSNTKPTSRTGLKANTRIEVEANEEGDAN